MSSSRISTRTGTRLTVIPPDRRSTAVVRAETGMSTTTSRLPVVRLRKQANAAMMRAAAEASGPCPSSDRSSLRIARFDNGDVTSRLSATAGAPAPTSVTPRTPSSRCAQYARSVSCLSDAR
ncbi:hypothetical protein RE9431_43580 [Prescottella equi]|nr:hypothetical protein RE9431_43580 [Prescottella equi]